MTIQRSKRQNSISQQRKTHFVRRYDSIVSTSHFDWKTILLWIMLVLVAAYGGAINYASNTNNSNYLVVAAVTSTSSSSSSSSSSTISATQQRRILQEPSNTAVCYMCNNDPNAVLRKPKGQYNLKVLGEPNVYLTCSELYQAGKDGIPTLSECTKLIADPIFRRVCGCTTTNNQLIPKPSLVPTIRPTISPTITPSSSEPEPEPTIPDKEPKCTKFIKLFCKCSGLRKLLRLC